MSRRLLPLAVTALAVLATLGAPVGVAAASDVSPANSIRSYCLSLWREDARYVKQQIVNAMASGDLASAALWRGQLSSLQANRCYRKTDSIAYTYCSVGYAWTRTGNIYYCSNNAWRRY
jgi:hypothetical protein